jgi:VWFA-related protein
VRAHLALTLAFVAAVAPVSIVSIAALATPLAQEPGGDIRIDAIVTDARGRVVDDLSADEFEVGEDGGTTRAESARFVRADGRVEPRVFGVLLDEYHVSPGPAVEKLRDLLTRFVEQALGPRDLVVLVRPLDSLLTLKATDDRTALLGAIRSFEGRKGDYEPRGTFERNYMAGTPARVEAMRSQIATSALNALAAHLGSLGEQRKSILLVSEGLPQAAGRRDMELPTVDTFIRTANRGSVSAYPVDPRALAPSAGGRDGGGPGDAMDPGDAGSPGKGPGKGNDDGRAWLSMLAAETSGVALLAPGDVESIEAGLNRMVADSSAYYVLAFAPAHRDTRGDFHGLQLRVTRPGLVVRTRKGYWSTSPDEALLARYAAKAAEPMPPPAPVPHASALIRPWFGVTRAPTGNMRVSFVWEPVPPVPGDRSRAGVPAVVTFKASTLDGATLFEGAVRPSAASADTGRSEETEAAFDTAPGRVRVQMAIADADARILDTDVRDVIVGGLAGPVAVGTAEVLRTRNARDLRALDADPGAVPIAAREFSRAERLLIRVPVYGPGDGVTVSASLQNGLGQAMRTLPALRLPDGDLYEIDLPLAALAAGDYAVQITARSGAREAGDVVRFRVTP